MKKWLVASSFLLLLTACGTDDEGTADEPQDDSDQDTVEETEDMDDDEGDDDEGSTVLDENDEGVTVLAEDLETPWNIEENDGTFYITERSTGEIVHVTEDSQESYPVEFSDELYTEIEAGLMGMALAPDFDETNEAFIYYTYGDEDEAFNKVARVAFDEEEGVWTEEDVLLDEIPGFRIHSGGRIAIGPDDLLYVGVGDVDEIHGQEGDTEGAMIAQDEDSYAGSILRMNLDGSVPEGNLEEDSHVYTYGHRNPQGLTWGEDGTMYATEHGPTGHDELNIIEGGNNYGWPVIWGDGEEEGMESPLAHAGKNTWAPSGVDYLDGNLYFTALAGLGVNEYNIETGEITQIVSGFDRVRDVMITDDSMYLLTHNTDGRASGHDNDDRLVQLNLDDVLAGNFQNEDADLKNDEDVESGAEHEEELHDEDSEEDADEDSEEDEEDAE